MVVLIKIVGTTFGAKNSDADLFLTIFPTSEHSLLATAGINRACNFKAVQMLPLLATAGINTACNFKAVQMLPKVLQDIERGMSCVCI